MSFRLGECISEIATLMLALIGASDRERTLGERHQAVLSEVTPEKVLLELRGRTFTQYVVELADWSEVPSVTPSHQPLYKLTTKGRQRTVYFFTVVGRRVRRVVREDA